MVTNTLLQNVEQLVSNEANNTKLFQQALWELLKLYNENEMDEFLRKSMINSGPQIRWENFQKDFRQAVEKYVMQLTSTQLAEVIKECGYMRIESFIRYFYHQQKKIDFSCHRDVCTLAAFLSDIIKTQSKKPENSLTEQFYQLALQRMHAFLYGIIAHNLITDCLDFAPQELEFNDEDNDEYSYIYQNQDW